MGKGSFFLLVGCLSLLFGLLLRGGPFIPPKCLVLPFLCPVPPIGGHVAEGFQLVQQTYSSLFQQGYDSGSQLVVYYRGRKVVDLHGGWSDLQTKKQYNHHTLSLSFSCSKVVSSLVVAMLVDRGLLNFEDPISKYWPEFGTNGKEKITLEQLMKHEAGLAFFPSKLNLTTIGDLDALANYLAKLEPQGLNQRFYHAITRDFVTNEIVRRVDPKQRTIGQFIREEIMKPLGIEFYIGSFPEEEEVRMAVSYPTPPHFLFLHVILPSFFPQQLQWGWGDAGSRVSMTKEFLGPNSMFLKAVGCVEWGSEEFNGKLFRSVEIASANGYTNAQSMAKLAALIANGGELDGVRLISKKALERAHSNPTLEFDHILKRNLNLTKAGWGNFVNTKGWNGMGGSSIRWNEEHQLGIGFTVSAREPVPYERFPRLEKSIFECIHLHLTPGESKEITKEIPAI